MEDGDETSSLLKQLEYYTNLINTHKRTTVNTSDYQKNENKESASCSQVLLPNQKVYPKEGKYKLEKVHTINSEQLVRNKCNKLAQKNSSSDKNVSLSPQVNQKLSTHIRSNVLSGVNGSQESVNSIKSTEHLPINSQAVDVFTSSKKVALSSNRHSNQNPYKLVKRNITPSLETGSSSKIQESLKTSNVPDKGLNKITGILNDHSTKYRYVNLKGNVMNKGQNLSNSVSKIENTKIKSKCYAHKNDTEKILKDEEKGPLFDIKKELDKINLLQTKLNTTQSTNKTEHFKKSISLNKYKLVKHSSPLNCKLGQTHRSSASQKQRVGEVYGHKCKLVKSKTTLPTQSQSVLTAKGPFKLVKKSHRQLGNQNLKKKRNHTNANNILCGKDNGRTSSKTSLSNCIVTRHKLVKKNIVKSAGSKNLHTSRKRSNVSLHKSKYKLVKQAVHSARLTKPQYHVTRKKYSLIKSTSDEVAEFDINKALGRKIVNLSSNKYKFIKPKSPAYFRLKRKETGKSKFRLDRRKLRSIKPMKRHGYVMATGHVFSTGGKRHGKHTGAWNIVLRRKSVRRLSEGSSSKSSTQLAARHALVRSIGAQHKYKKDHRIIDTPTKSHKFCLYYNRFGRCSRGNSCQFIHDPNKVAVCTRFLRGTCQVNNCPFSHKISKEKMPVCKFFLKGQCHKEDCPYLHVNVGVDADVCEDFVNGYCKEGDKCTKKHVWVCPEFEKNGECTKGKACKMQHLKKVKSRKRKSTSCPVLSHVQPKLAKEKNPSLLVLDSNIVSPDDKDDISLPMRDRQLPAFISIDTASNESSLRHYRKQSGLISSFEIKPNLLEETGIKIIEDG